MPQQDLVDFLKPPPPPEMALPALTEHSSLPERLPSAQVKFQFLQTQDGSEVELPRSQECGGGRSGERKGSDARAR